MLTTKLSTKFKLFL